MQPTFRPPETEAEFETRAAEIDTRSAKVMLNTLKKRREDLVAQINPEIEFYAKILKQRGVTE